MNELEIIKLFCLVDDFSKKFENMCSQEAIQYKKKKIRNKTSRTSLSELMTILLLFHQSNYRTFKHFYLRYVKIHLQHLFPKLVGYLRFIQMIADAFFPMFYFVNDHQGSPQGIYFIDSTLLTVCHVKRTASHKTFKSMAKWGKTTTGWFFGLKLRY